jgi:hypothetical protein
MLEELFGSKTRVKLLTLLFTNPGHAFYVREITRLINEQVNSVRRELLNLKNIDLVVSKERRGKLYYEANQKSDFFTDIKNIFEKTGKAVVTEDKLTSLIRRSGDVVYAALMGGFVGDNSSQVDFFIVGDVDEKKMKNAISELEKKLGKEVNYCLMSNTEFEDRSMLFDRFITEIMANPKKVIINKLKKSKEEEASK